MQIVKVIWFLYLKFQKNNFCKEIDKQFAEPLWNKADAQVGLLSQFSLLIIFLFF